jgi:hypothetical protein
VIRPYIEAAQVARPIWVRAAAGVTMLTYSVLAAGADARSTGATRRA